MQNHSNELFSPSKPFTFIACCSSHRLCLSHLTHFSHPCHTKSYPACRDTTNKLLIHGASVASKHIWTVASDVDVATVIWVFKIKRKTLVVTSMVRAHPTSQNICLIYISASLSSRWFFFPPYKPHAHTSEGRSNPTMKPPRGVSKHHKSIEIIETFTPNVYS